MSESFELDDEIITGRSLSELSLNWTQTAGLISGVSVASVEELDGGEHGEYGEFFLNYEIPGASSRTGSYSAGRSLSQSSVQNESMNCTLIRPHAEIACKETVRALKRKLESSESSGRTPSQELQDALSGFDDDCNFPPESQYNDGDIDGGDWTVVPPEDLIPALRMPETGDLHAGPMGDRTSDQDILNEILFEARTGADGQTRMVLRPTSFQARLLVIQWFESIRLIESNCLSENPLQHCRTLSDRPFPQPTDFTVRRISAGAGRLFGCLPAQPSGIIDIPMLTRLCRPGRQQAVYPARGGDGRLESVEADLLSVAGAKDLAGTKRKGKGGDEDKVCTLRLRLLNGDDNVVLRIWRDGNTQASGCSSPEAVWAANCLAHRIILQLAVGPGGAGLLRADAGDLMHLARGDVWDVRLERLAIMGGWDCGFDAVHARLNMDRLVTYLTSAHSGIIENARRLGSDSAQGAGSRFGQVGIYVKRRGLEACRDDSDTRPIYVNLSQSGKCVALGVTSVEVGRELASKLTAILVQAFAEPAEAGLRENIEARAGRQRRP